MSRRTGFVLVFAILAGCVSPQTRMQMGDEVELKKDLSVKTIADIAEIRAVGPVQVSGIGLVTGLDGTGSCGAPDNPYRKVLDQMLRKQRIERVKEILDSPDNALVLVSAFIMPGARLGDRFDAEVTLPPGSRSTSLAGGTLQICALRNHDSAKSLNPNYVGPDRALAGLQMAHAKGPIVVGLGDGTTAGDTKRGLVWRGAASHIELPYLLELKTDSKSTRVGVAVADRLNFLFQEDPQRLQRLSRDAQRMFLLDDMAQQINHKIQHAGSFSAQIAKVKGKDGVQMRVPYAYRLNPDRFLYVTNLVPLAEDPDHMVRYKRRLQKLLGDPAETIMAARRLEALGREGLQPLRDGLTHEHPLVRFASAEALAYLGDTSGTDELGRIAPRHAMLAGGCVTALASLDEPSCRRRLVELLNDGNPELRSTAFAMLRQLAEQDSPEPGLKAAWGGPYREFLIRDLGGEWLGSSFWLHRVAPKSSRLVSFSADLRAEVVLFGDGIALSSSVRTLAGPTKEFALTYEAGSDKCVLSRISAQVGKRQTLCPPTLEDVIRTMAELGADYADVVDLIRKLDERHCLNCPARLNTPLPDVTPQMLVEAQRDGTLWR